MKMTEILPGKGIGKLLVGMDKDTCTELLGLPFGIYPTKDNFNPEIDHSYYWRYNKYGLDLEFDKKGGGVVNAIHVFVSKHKGYIAAKIKGKINKENIRKQFGKPYMDGTIDSEGMFDTYKDGLTVFYNKRGKIDSFCVFDPAVASVQAD